MNIKIIVAAHKPYRMPQSSMYLPVHVGKNGGDSIGFQGDDTGDNISWKNPNYCELTGLYWAWKNLDADYLGLAHYRRHFSGKGFLYRLIAGRWNSILTRKDAERFLKDTDILLPSPRGYVIESIYEHYCHTHYPEPLNETRIILVERYPEMVPVFDEVMNKRKAHMFNMYIMKRELSDAYCEFLFEVLGELERRIDISGYNPFQARVYGRISELLLDVWISYHGYSFKEISMVYMESQHWVRKVRKFLRSKFKRQYY